MTRYIPKEVLPSRSHRAATCQPPRARRLDIELNESTSSASRERFLKFPKVVVNHLFGELRGLMFNASVQIALIIRMPKTIVIVIMTAVWASYSGHAGLTTYPRLELSGD